MDWRRIDMADTVRLYYEDVMTRDFTAKVLECRKEKKGFSVILDRSAFYPEGGGQPCDTGMIGNAKVTDVQEKDGELRHFTDSLPEEGSVVSCTIDWERRFDLMQQHSGEHLVSGLVHERYGYENVGFHMGSDVITIDFSGVLTWEQLLSVEEEANRRVWEDKETEITFPDPEELSSIPYRSKKELTGQVRIVTFPGTDICACCGTHVRRTGEIGMIKILSVVRFHEGVRVEMISGNRVLCYLRMLQEQNHEVSMLLSAKPEATGAAVKRVLEENSRLKYAYAGLESESFDAEAQKWTEKGSALIFRGEMEADSVRRLADRVMHTCGGRAAVFSANPDGSFKYAIGEENGDLRQFTKEMNAVLSGRGGGKPFFVQGSVKASEEEIRAFFS